MSAPIITCKYCEQRREAIANNNSRLPTQIVPEAMVSMLKQRRHAMHGANIRTGFRSARYTIQSKTICTANRKPVHRVLLLDCVWTTTRQPRVKLFNAQVHAYSNHAPH